MLRSKCYATITSKYERLGSKKIPPNLEIKVCNYFFSYIIFLSIWKALIHSIWISGVKVVELLV